MSLVIGYPNIPEIEATLRGSYEKTREKQADEQALQLLPTGLDLLAEQDRLLELVEKTL